MKIRSTTDLHYAIPATLFLVEVFSYVRFCHDFDVTVGLSFFLTVILLFYRQISTYLLV